ncbi:MAG: hypothetical protein K0R10_2504 [Alphaproteobacteria bacterium]|jgi:hypothetical protein|nr:hypothetical protein [Alphaproteobacteria bacterium]
MASENGLIDCAKKKVGKTGLMLRCSGALLTGLAIVTVITMSLVVMSDADEMPAKTAFYNIEFPEDEAALERLSTQLARETEADELNEIEPAAGDVTTEDVPQPQPAE